MSEPLAEANALLRGRHRRYCEDRLHAFGAPGPVQWDDDDDAVLTRAMLQLIPLPVQEAFILSRVENLTYAQIAKRTGTFRWVVHMRVSCGVRHVAQRPTSFERWLRNI